MQNLYICVPYCKKNDGRVRWLTWGYWRRRDDCKLDDSPPAVHPGAFNGQRQGWKTPKRTPWHAPF